MPDGSRDATTGLRQTWSVLRDAVRLVVAAAARGLARVGGARVIAGGGRVPCSHVSQVVHRRINQSNYVCDVDMFHMDTGTLIVFRSQ